MHPDHVGGLVADGKIVFPNAMVRADQGRCRLLAQRRQPREGRAEGSKGFFQGAQASLKPYVDAGRFKAISADSELVPGIKAVATHGHTQGHRIYVVESKGQKLVLWGDLMHVAAVQFATPSVTIAFDTDQKAALAQRRKAFADAAKQGYFIGASHLSFPGIGHLSAQGTGYSFQPTNYTTSLKK